MVEQGELLRVDPFSYTRLGEPYPAPGWPVQILLYLVYLTSGIGALNLLTGFVFTLAFYFVSRALSGSELLQASALLLGAAVSSLHASLFYLEAIAMKSTTHPQGMSASALSLKYDPVALQMALAEVDISIIGYFYAVDFGPGVRPQHHRVGKNAICTCYLGELCPAVDLVRAYLAVGGERAPEPPPGFYQVRLLKCPICGAETAYEPSLNSQRRGAGWRCLKGGSGHYWHKKGLVLAEKFTRNPWLFPPVVLREGQ